MEHFAADMRGSGGEPLAVVGAIHLLTRLLEHDRPILVLLDPEQALGTDDVLREGREEFLEFILGERLTAIVHKGADAVLLYLTALVMMVVMVAAVAAFFMMIMVMIIVVVMFIVVVMMVLMLIMIVMVSIFIMVIFVNISIQLLHPSGGGSDLVKVEVVGVQDLADCHLTMSSLNDLCLGLKRADDLSDIDQLFLRDEVDLVEDDGVAELDLLDQQVLDILVVDIVIQESAAAAEFATQTSRVNDGYDVVQTAELGQSGIVVGAVEHGDGLRDRDRLTNTRSLDQDVIELLLLYQAEDLLDQIGLESTADTAVLERYKVLVLFVDNAALLDQLSVNINLADIVDDDGDLIALLVVEHMIQ